MKNFVLLPMANLLGGKTQQIDLRIDFEISTDKGLQYNSVKGTISEIEYDMDYLTHSHGILLTELVLGNRINWGLDEIWYRNTGSGFQFS